MNNKPKWSTGYIFRQAQLAHLIGDFSQELASLERYKCQFNQLGPYDIIYFGQRDISGYYPPNKPIDFIPFPWIVLRKEATKLHLLSKDIIYWNWYDGNSTFLEPSPNTCWANSTIREELNQEYYPLCFSDYESQLIVEAEVVTSNNPLYDTKGGQSTKDRLFLLAADELPENLPLEANLVAGYYDAEAGKCFFNKTRMPWWLRTPGNQQDSVAIVDDNGKLDLFGMPSDADECGIRPAMWIDIGQLDRMISMLHNK